MTIFSFVGHILSYFEKLTIDNKYINKQPPFFIHQTICISKITCSAENIILLYYKSVELYTSASACRIINYFLFLLLLCILKKHDSSTLTSETGENTDADTVFKRG